MRGLNLYNLLSATGLQELPQPVAVIITVVLAAALGYVFGYYNGHSAGFKIGWHECEKWAAKVMKEIAGELQ